MGTGGGPRWNESQIIDSFLVFALAWLFIVLRHSLLVAKFGALFQL